METKLCFSFYQGRRGFFWSGLSHERDQFRLYNTNNNPATFMTQNTSLIIIKTKTSLKKRFPKQNGVAQSRHSVVYPLVGVPLSPSNFSLLVLGAPVLC